MGLFDVFKKGLAKTRDAVMGGLRSVLPIGKKIDEQLLDDLEFALIEGDMGPEAVADLIDEVRGAWKARELQEAQEIVPFLKKRIDALWQTTPSSYASPMRSLATDSG